jgi:hypothetical protein
MFARHTFQANATVALFSILLSSTGCLTELVAPEHPSKTGKRDWIEPCSASPDLSPNGRIDASDLAVFVVHEKHQNLAADLNGNGSVDGFDRRILEFFLGQAYEIECLQSLVSLPEGCHPYASPDITGDGLVTASDLAAFFAAAGNTAMADFNGDGVVNALDQIILEPLLGTAYVAEPCGGETGRRSSPSPDMNGDGWVDAADLALFAAAGTDLSADFTGNGGVNEYDRKVLEMFMGRAYEPSGALPLWRLAEGCHQYASPDITGDGLITASDLAAFYSGAATLAMADFNGDGVINGLDEVIILDRVGTSYAQPSCDSI